MRRLGKHTYTGFYSGALQFGEHERVGDSCVSEERERNASVFKSCHRFVSA